VLLGLVDGRDVDGFVDVINVEVFGGLRVVGVVEEGRGEV